MANGLQPRAGYDNTGRIEYDDPRIFFDEDYDSALDMFEWLGHPGEVVVFKVLVPAGVKFYDDLDAGKGAYWTSDPISPDYLELVEDE
jgi:hypothetical protein